MTAFPAADAGLVQTLNSVDDVRSQPQGQMLDLYNLSPAQKRIAELVAQAYPNREIARRLKIKEQSVRNELSRIFRKMGVWNRVELALLMRNGQGEEHNTDAKNAWPVGLKPPVGASTAETRTTV